MLCHEFISHSVCARMSTGGGKKCIIQGLQSDGVLFEKRHQIPPSYKHTHTPTDNPRIASRWPHILPRRRLDIRARKCYIVARPTGFVRARKKKRLWVESCRECFLFECRVLVYEAFQIRGFLFPVPFHLSSPPVNKARAPPARWQN